MPGPPDSASAVGWAPGTATGVGSLPGTDLRRSLELTLEYTPGLPYLPELPARGPGADLLGRGAGFLSGLAVDLQPFGWRLVDRPGRDARRTADLIAADLDCLAEVAGDWSGPFKLQAAGPWTLAAGLELPRGRRALSDAAAVRDLADSLADGLATHLRSCRERLPAAGPWFVQLDEPSLPDVLAGALPTPSGWGTLPAVEAGPLAELLRGLVTALVVHGAVVGVHCCAREVPLPVVVDAGAHWVSLDVSQPSTAALDALGEAAQAGLTAVLGVVAVAAPGPSTASHAAAQARRVATATGLDTADGPRPAALSPTCGLAGLAEESLVAVLAALREAGARLADAG